MGLGGLSFTVDLLHRGFIFKDPVMIYLVAEGHAQRVSYTPDLFTLARDAARGGHSGGFLWLPGAGASQSR